MQNKIIFHEKLLKTEWKIKPPTEMKKTCDDQIVSSVSLSKANLRELGLIA